MIETFNHVSLIVTDTQRAVDFYQDVLGLTLDTSRPDLDFPGAWFEVGDQNLHLLEIPNPDPVNGRAAHGGRDRHTAFNVSDVTGLKKSFDHHQISYTESRSGRKAVFCRDPDGNALEFIES